MTGPVPALAYGPERVLSYGRPPGALAPTGSDGRSPVRGPLPGPGAVPGPAHSAAYGQADAVTGPLPALRLVRPARPVAPSPVPGMLWAAILLAGAILGAGALAAAAAPVAVIACATALRGARRGSRARGLAGRPGDRRAAGPALGAAARLAAAVLVGVVPLAAVAGPAPAVLVGVSAVLVAAGTSPALSVAPLRAALIAALTASAAGSLVLAREQGFTIALALVVTVCLYDAAAYLMGNGPGGGVLGTAAGLATTFALGFILYSIDNPPFAGWYPWAFAVGGGVLAAVGTRAAGHLLGPGRAPAFRRLDSLFLAGPVWIAACAVFFHL